MPFKYRETPVQEIYDPVCKAAGVRLLVKREDLNHPHISGNKWWKLKYNVEEARAMNCHTILTFGGAYSNHIYATAAAARETGFKSIGIIRGEETLPLNHTLSFAERMGMELHYVSRTEYRHKTNPDFIQDLTKQFGEFYLIPEGGTNALALQGCSEFATDFLSDMEYDVLCLPVGTGGTIAGIVKGLSKRKEVLGFSSLKGTFLEEEVRNLLDSDVSESAKGNWTINTNYHFGGYGKRTDELEDFIVRQQMDHGLPLDIVYTSKMMFGIYDLIGKGKFKKGSVILALHTGGLQAGSVCHEPQIKNNGM